MTIAQCLPRWLRSRLPRPVPQKLTTVNKKDRQVLPTLPKPERLPIRWQDDDSPAGCRIQWRL